MSVYTEDRCSSCKKITSKELLVIKQVNFLLRTDRRKVVRSRAVAWLCEPCLEADADYNAEPYSGPGNRSAPLERVREDRVVD